MATHEAQQKTNEAAEMAKQKLEIGAKELQEKLGGAENNAVVTSQIVIPSEVGKKAQEVTLLQYLVECSLLAHLDRQVAIISSQ